MRASSNKSTSGSKSRYHGNITIEMIDDFLDPISKKKDYVSKVKFAPTSSTEGQGFVKEDENQRGSAVRNIPFNLRDTGDNFDYVVQNKRNYEKELQDTSSVQSNFNLEASFILENSVHNEDRSIVGSALSQIESVSTMHISSTKKKTLMNHAQKISLMRYEEDGSIAGDENNNLGAEAVNQMLNEAKNLIENDEIVKRQQMLEQLCANYSLRSKYNVNLPITEKKSKLITFMNTYPFCIIQGSTGCGKTTQVPQYILDSHVQEKKYCNIIVTQPRRIAAISVAKRVCQERNWQLGSICGYQIGLDNQHVSEDTRITYCTTGVLLQKLIGPQAEENFEKYTHIILDEVHERDLDTDFVLLIVKIKSFRNLKSKIILMSATIDCDLFRKYYALQGEQFIKDKDGKNALRLVPVHSIENTPFKVQEYYWDDLVADMSLLEPTIIRNMKSMQAGQNDRANYSTYQRNTIYSYSRHSNSNQRFITSNYGDSQGPLSLKNYKKHMENLYFNPEEPSMYDETMSMVITLLKHFDEEESRRIQSEHGINESDTDLNKPRIIDGFPEIRGSVLIFVPGMQQIHQLTDLINKDLPNLKLNVLPLHSDIIIEQQVRVFEKSDPTWRKVIISTSIAESSITVPDIKYVIDFCLTKELYCDPYTNYTHLRLEWASKSSINQRRGRAGRVSDGICYRLVSKAFHGDLDDHNKPAILREPLSSVILNVKRLKQVGEPKRILSLAIQPPKLSDIERTVLLLKEVGALTLKLKKYDGTITNNPYDGDLTYVGRVMANLPIDVRLSKLILFGHAFGKLRETIIIAAGLSTKTIFTCHFKSYMESFKAKWTWSDGWMCDSICILNVFNLWESMNERGSFNSRNDQLKWAKQNMIELNRLKEVVALKHELESRLRQFNIICNRDITINNRRKNKKNAASVYDIDDEKDSTRQNLILKMILTSAFYPNYFNAQTLDIEQAERSVCLKDIKNTVQIKNLPNNEGFLYHQKLTELFRFCSNSIQLHFENTKAYIEFKNQYEHAPSTVNIAIYLAVQMRLMRIPMQLKRFSPAVTQEKLRRNEQTKKFHDTIHMELDRNYSGMLKLNLSYDQKSSECNDDTYIDYSDDDDTSTIKSFDNYQDHLKFQSDEKSNIIDLSRYMSCASIISKQEEQNARNNDSMSSRSFLSKKQSVSQYIAPMSSSILDILSNPTYILPKEVDKGKMIKIEISHIVECGLFWAQIVDNSNIDTLEHIQKTLNNISSQSLNHMSHHSSSLSLDSTTSSKYPLKVLNPNTIKVGMLCVTTYTDSFSNETLFYRGQILSVNKDAQKCNVLFVDFGNQEEKKFKELFELSRSLTEYPFRAFQCRLANIKMSLFNNPNGKWTAAATKKFKDILKKSLQLNNDFKIKVFYLDESNTAQCSLASCSSDHDWYDIGEELIKNVYAEPVDESALNLMRNKHANSSNILYMPNRKVEYTRTRPQVTNADNERMLYKEKLESNKLSISVSDFDTTIDSQLERYDSCSSIVDSYITGRSSHADHLDDINEDESSYSGYIELNGPYSPIEVNYFSIMNVGHSKRVRVERNSINYVTLDDDPYNECSRLMVAGEVTLNSNGDTMILRKTSVMPKLPGLTSICCLLFSPQVEFRTDEKRTRFIGALCGLGYDSQGPIYTDNDVETAFDVNIDMQDVIMINSVRLAVNLVIGSEEAVQTWNNNSVNLRQLQERACDKLLQVIQRNRKRVEPVFYERRYRWNMYHPNDLISVMPQETDDEIKQIYYTYHQVVRLNNSEN